MAAFAHFVLDLSSLGAPPDLMLDAIRAMGDEVEHARLSFSIARELAGVVAAPGRMDISKVVERRDDPESILIAAIEEGCFGETVSAAYSRSAHDLAEEPRLRPALARIADDEARHADLSWRFVAWMLEAFPELRPSAEACFARALATRVEVDENDDGGSLFERYGLLSPSSREQVREATMRDTIVPRATALFGSLPRFAPDAATARI